MTRGLWWCREPARPPRPDPQRDDGTIIRLGQLAKRAEEATREAAPPPAFNPSSRCIAAVSYMLIFSTWDPHGASVGCFLQWYLLALLLARCTIGLYY